MDYAARVAALRQAAPEFERTMQALSAAIPAVRGHARASSDLRDLLNEGQGIRAAIRKIAKLIDDGQRWIGRTFQADAMETIPFAPEIVSSTAAGSLSAIQHFQNRAHAFLAAAQPAITAFAARAAQSADGVHEASPETLMPEVEVTAEPPRIWPAVILVGVLGALAWAWHSQLGEPNFLD